MDPALQAFATSLLEDDKQKQLKNVRRLQAFVATNSATFAKTDYFKLWEALFFAMWSADGPVVQRRIGVDFCHLIRYVPYNRVEIWFDAFWFVLLREWDKLDRYRIDKFHLFIRMFLAESLHWVKSQKWSDEAIEKLVTAWAFGPLKVPIAGESVPAGVSYHIVEVIMEELRHETKDDEIFQSNTLVKILKPFLTALCQSEDPVLADKIQKKILLALDATVYRELESVAENLFEQVATMKSCNKVQRVYSVIHAIDLALTKLGRQADYTSIIERVKQNINEDAVMGLSVSEMMTASNKAKRLKKSTKKIKKKKEKKVYKVFSTRRKKVAGKQRVA